MSCRFTHIFFLVLLFVSSPVTADIFRVGPGCTYATPQLAFAVARDGDTVRVRSGNYAGPFMIAWAIRVEGGYDDCSTTARSGRSDFHGNAPGQSSESLLRIPSPFGQVVLDRITLRDNIKTSGDGAGIHMTSASLALNDVEIRNNRALDGNGGGIYLDDSEVELVFNGSVLLEANRANSGGAIAATGDEASIHFYLGAIGNAATFRNNRVNVTTGTNRGGGSAIRLSNGADAALVDTLIEVDGEQDNIMAGSAILVIASPLTSGLLMRNSEMVRYGFHNRYNAIIAGVGSSNVDIDIQDTVIDGWRTGLTLYDGNAVLTRVRFENNSSDSFGGGVLLRGDAFLEGHSLEFINNTSSREGGAMAVIDTASWSISGAPGFPSRFVGNKVPITEGMGGAIYHGSSGSGRINDYPLEWGMVEFRDNWAWSQFAGESARRGGAIAIDDDEAALDLRSPLAFNHNSADSGGAIYVNRGELNLDARPGEQITLVNNWAYQGNVNPATNGNGGAIYRHADATVRINGTAGKHGEVLFSDNHAGGLGGSIFSTGPGYLLIQAPVRFDESNGTTKADYGGHIYARAYNGQQALIEMQGWDGSGRGIVIAGGSASMGGGGMYLEGVTAILDWVQFGLADQPNQTYSGDGANLLAYGFQSDVTLRNSSLAYGKQGQRAGRGHGLMVASSAQVLMESVYGLINTPPAPGEAWPCLASTLAADRHCSEIINNGWPYGPGGGVFVDTGAQLSLRGVTIDGNQGSPGGLVIENGGSVDARNVRISGNLGGIGLLDGAQMVAQHLTVAGNSATAIELANTASTVMDLSNSVVWGNSGNIIAGSKTSLTINCNISQTAALGQFADPGFVHSARGQYRLGAGSPALDKCENSLALVDLDGNSRPQGFDYDIGAFEGVSVPIPDLIFKDGFE